MNLKQLIHEALEEAPDGDPHDIAKRIRRRVPAEDILNLIAREVEWTQRGIARLVEQQGMAAFRSRFASTPLPPLPGVDDGLRALFRSTFHLGDGTSVTWGDATIEQHEQRIAFLSIQRDGITRTIDQHREAIRAIQAAGTSCLNDLQDKAA